MEIPILELSPINSMEQTTLQSDKITNLMDSTIWTLETTIKSQEVSILPMVMEISSKVLEMLSQAKEILFCHQMMPI